MVSVFSKKEPKKEGQVPTNTKEYIEFLDSIYVRYLKGIDPEDTLAKLDNVVKEKRYATSMSNTFDMLIGMPRYSSTLKMHKEGGYIPLSFPALMVGFKEFYNLTDNKMPKSLPLYRTKEITKCFYNKSVDTSIFTRFDPNLLKVKSLYLANDNNYNFIGFANSGESITGVSFKDIKKEILKPLIIKYTEGGVTKSNMIRTIRSLNLAAPNDKDVLFCNVNYEDTNGRYRSYSVKLKKSVFKPSKFLSKVFDIVKAHESGIAQDLFDAYIKSKTEVVKNIKVVEGNLIPFLYYGKMYTSESHGMLHSSCMRESSSPALYSPLKDVVKMLVLFDKKGKVKGRALLWKAISEEYIQDYINNKIPIKDIPNITKDVIDRVYYDCNDTGNVFASYARMHNIKTSYGSTSNLGIDSINCFVPLPNLGLKDALMLSSVLATGGTPYFDSFGNLKEEKGHYFMVNKNGRGRGEHSSFRNISNPLVSRTTTSFSQILNNFKDPILEAVIDRVKKKDKLLFKIGDNTMNIDVSLLNKEADSVSTVSESGKATRFLLNVLKNEKIIRHLLEELVLQLVGKDLLHEKKVPITEMIGRRRRNSFTTISSVNDIRSFIENFLMDILSRIELESIENYFHIFTSFIDIFENAFNRMPSDMEVAKISNVFSFILLGYTSFKFDTVSLKHKRLNYLRRLLSSYTKEDWKMSDNSVTIESEDIPDDLINLKSYYTEHKDKSIKDMSSVELELLGRYLYLKNEKANYKEEKFSHFKVEFIHSKYIDDVYFKVDPIDDMYYFLHMYVKIDGRFYNMLTHHAVSSYATVSNFANIYRKFSKGKFDVKKYVSNAVVLSYFVQSILVDDFYNEKFPTATIPSEYFDYISYRVSQKEFGVSNWNAVTTEIAGTTSCNSIENLTKIAKEQKQKFEQTINNE